MKKKKTISKLLIIATLIPHISLANQSVEIKKDDPAPFSGTLLDKEKSRSIKDELIEKDGLSKINESYKKSINLYKSNEDILNEKSDMLLKQNIELTKTINDIRETSTLTKVLYFSLGIVITGTAVWGASRLAR